MHQPIVCTVCSREKDKTAKLIPARERYLGSHIALALEEARKENLPCYILSGKFGLIAADQVVEYYEYQLLPHMVPPLRDLVGIQLRCLPFGVTELRFVTKEKPSWQPYIDALMGAAERLRIPIKPLVLSDAA